LSGLDGWDGALGEVLGAQMNDDAQARSVPESLTVEHVRAAQGLVKRGVYGRAVLKTFLTVIEPAGLNTPSFQRALAPWKAAAGKMPALPERLAKLREDAGFSGGKVMLHGPASLDGHSVWLMVHPARSHSAAVGGGSASAVAARQAAWRVARLENVPSWAPPAIPRAVAASAGALGDVASRSSDAESLARLTAAELFSVAVRADDDLCFLIEAEAARRYERLATAASSSGQESQAGWEAVIQALARQDEWSMAVADEALQADQAPEPLGSGSGSAESGHDISESDEPDASSDRGGLEGNSGRPENGAVSSEPPPGLVELDSATRKSSERIPRWLSPFEVRRCREHFPGCCPGGR